MSANGHSPVPGSPAAWAPTSMPARRDGPPYHMTEMIEAEPALARRILDRLSDPNGAAAELARRIRAAAASRRPVIATGCGTSEHGAQAVAAIVGEGLRIVGLPSASGAGGSPVAAQAFEAALDETLGSESGILVAISHEGATWATNEALVAARARGIETALITVSDRSPGAALADVVVTTAELDTSWCHTIGYLSPVLAAVAIAAHIRGERPDAPAIESLLAAALTPDAIAATEEVAARLAAVDRVVVVASGADPIAAHELVLKIEEGTHLPAAMRDLETLLHGHLAGMDERTGVVAILADRHALDRRVERLRTALAACSEIRSPAGAIVSRAASEAIPAALTPTGRIVVDGADSLAPAVGALLATAIPLQLLTERLARALGVDPDPIRRDDPAYLRAASV